MTKPVIITRAGKGLALDYTELDTNFTNLRDSTINFTDGTNTRSMDLNDVTTLAGEKNIQLTVNESTQTITVKNTLSDYAFDPIGFENITDAAVSFNTGTRTLTIQPVSTNYRYWWKGTQRTVTTTKTVVIPNTTGQYLVYFNDETLSYKLGEPDWANEVPVSYVYWNATAGQGFFSKELHTISMDWKTKEYLHETQTAAYADGLTISNYTTTGTGANNTDAQFDISSGVIYDQDIAVNITHSNSPAANSWEQDLQGPSRIPVVYHSGSTGSWVMDTARDYAVKNGTSLVTYNLNTAGTWTTPDVTSTHFVAYWIIATNFLNTPVISIMGQRHDNKLTDAAINNTWGSLDLTNFPAEEFRPLYRVIFRTGSAYTNTPKAYIAQVDDFRFSTIIPQGGPSISVNNITEGDSNITVTDTGSGLITMTVDGSTIADVNSSRLKAKQLESKSAKIPFAFYQSSISASAVIPASSPYAIDLTNASETSGNYFRQTVWEIDAMGTTSPEIQITLNDFSIYPMDLIFTAYPSGSPTTITLTLRFELDTVSSGNVLRAFFSDNTTYNTSTNFTKTFTLTGRANGTILWLKLHKTEDLTFYPASSLIQHYMFVEILANDQAIP